MKKRVRVVMRYTLAIFFWVGLFVMFLTYPIIGDFLWGIIMIFAVFSILYCIYYYVRKLMKKCNEKGNPLYISCCLLGIVPYWKNLPRSRRYDSSSGNYRFCLANFVSIKEISVDYSIKK